MKNYNEFEGKLAVVTGAAKGIGKAIADELQTHYCQVARLDIAFESDVIKNHFKVDVSDSESVNSVVDTIEAELGEIDYLVSVAGILNIGKILETNDESWQRSFDVNTTGPFNLCRAVGKYMQQRQRGSIVAVSSNASKIPRIAMGAYAASKAATTQLIKCLGLELAKDNIRCNIISPGSTDTDMQRQVWDPKSGIDGIIQGSLENYRTGIPLQRIATLKNIAEVVLFLLSDKAQHLTMQDITVDGGATLGC